MTREIRDAAASAALQQARSRWDERFSGSDYLFGDQPNAYLESKKGLLGERGRALCVADGEGRNSVWLAEQGFQVHAFDFSPAAVKKAQQLAVRRKVSVEFKVAELFDWNWTPSTYDLVAAIFIQFASPAERERLFPLMFQTLKPGGLLILQGYRPEQLKYGTGGPTEPDHLYVDSLIRALLRDMEILEMRSYDEAVDEGRGHSGMSALLGVVARKPK